MKKIELIKALLDDSFEGKEKKEKCEVSGSDIQIVILQRGWVAIGKYSESGDECTLEDAKIIRTWGTTKGLGEIAEGGPTANTKLDDCPSLRFNKMTVIARMDVNEKNWSNIF